MGRRRYPPEFRRKVLDLVEAGRPIAEALGISDQSIYTWRRQDRIDRGLEPGLTTMAIQARTPPAGAIVHSDQGCSRSWAFTQRAKDSGLVPSMGSVGDCYDNAMIEAFWSRMQVELLDPHRWKPRVELANAIFEYLEIFHNRQRRHSSLGMLTRYSSSGRPPWHENPTTRLHETRGIAGCPPDRVNSTEADPHWLCCADT